MGRVFIKGKKYFDDTQRENFDKHRDLKLPICSREPRFWYWIKLFVTPANR